MMSTWGVTTADVLNATKQTVTDADIAMAGEIIDLFSNRTQEASASMRVRDRVWLAKAVMWQSVKCKAEPDLASRLMVQATSQDGVSIQLNMMGTGKEWYAFLAPFAARALKNLSWKGTRSQRTLPMSQPLGRSVLPQSFLSEAQDDYGKWEDA